MQRHLRFARVSTALVALALVNAALTGCSTPDRVVEKSSVTVAVSEPFTSYNPDTSFGSTAVNDQVSQATNANFFGVTDELEVQADTSFGIAEVVGNDPLSVKYTVNEGVNWSDGTAVDAADLLLAWAANSGALNTVGFDDTPYVDAATGRYSDSFPSDVVWFDGGRTSGLQFVTALPVIGDGGRSLTLDYDEYFVDWQLAFAVGLPAHVVGRLAGNAAASPSPSPSPMPSPMPTPMPTPTPMPSPTPSGAAAAGVAAGVAAAAKAAVIAAVYARDATALAGISRVWNSSLNASPRDANAIDPALLVGSGPYTAAIEGGDVVLSANARYTGDHKPQYEEVIVRVIEDPADAIRALAAGTVDVIAPPASAANAEALVGLGAVTVVGGFESGFEQLELRFADSRSGLFDDPILREAFLKVVPRQQVVDTLLGPFQEDAMVRSSFVFFPGSRDYENSIAVNGSAAYAGTDVPGAQALLAQAGIARAEVCVLFDPTDPLRVEEFALLRQAAAPAGFTVTDCSRKDWESILGVPGAYDASLVDWPTTARPVTGAIERLRSGAPGNSSGYSSATTDALLEVLAAEKDEKERTKLLGQIDAQLFADFYGMPLFQLPSLTAYSTDVEGIARSPLNPGLLWNVWQWHPASSTEAG